MGDAIARAAWPQRIARDGTLLVAAVSSTWAFELGLLADEILAKLAAAVASGAPTAIRFAPGPVPAPPAPHPSEAAVAPLRRWTTRPGSWPSELTSGMSDADLRATIARAAAASLAKTASSRHF